ncbi:hypothetical protein EDC96DRAFT_545543 [Choanephora cucurbitarum]|nr:hypothetical protein EDC96DRAFT_545543 [Choanephora cucurbitarum]
MTPDGKILVRVKRVMMVDSEQRDADNYLFAQNVHCTYHKNKGLASLDLSDGTLFGHITGKSIMPVMLLMGIKGYLYGRVLLIDILDYTIDQLIQTTLDASELCTVTTSCLRLTSTNC